MKREPLLLWCSILVTLQILTGGAALGDFIGLRLAGLLILGVAALQGGTQFYIRGQVTPTADVVAQVPPSGVGVVAGPASIVEDGEPVKVEALQ